MKSVRLDMRIDQETKDRLIELANEHDCSLSQVVRMLIKSRNIISVPIIGTISEKGIKINEYRQSFEKLNGRKPVAGKDYNPDASMSQDEHDYLAGEGIYA